jgi:hypothetical protein
MANQVKKFIQEHKNLLDNLSKFKKLDIDKGKNRKRFTSAIKELRSHLKKEDKKIISTMINKMQVSSNSAKEMNLLLKLKFPRFFWKKNKRGICHSLSL